MRSALTSNRTTGNPAERADMGDAVAHLAAANHADLRHWRGSVSRLEQCIGRPV